MSRVGNTHKGKVNRFVIIPTFDRYSIQRISMTCRHIFVYNVPSFITAVIESCFIIPTIPHFFYLQNSDFVLVKLGLCRNIFFFDIKRRNAFWFRSSWFSEKRIWIHSIYKHFGRCRDGGYSSLVLVIPNISLQLVAQVIELYFANIVHWSILCRQNSKLCSWVSLNKSHMRSLKSFCSWCKIVCSCVGRIKEFIA